MVLAPALVVNTNEKATAASVLMSIFFALIIFVFITLIFLIVKLTVSYLVAQRLFVLIELRSKPLSLEIARITVGSLLA